MSELTVADEAAEVDTAVDPKTPPKNPHFKPKVVAPARHVGPEVRFPLPGGNEVVITLKKPVSKKDFDRITQLLELSEESLVEDEKADGSEFI